MTLKTISNIHHYNTPYINITIPINQPNMGRYIGNEIKY